MNEYRMRTQVRQAVEQKCAFFQPNPHLAQRVLNAAEENRRGKARKTTWGLILFLVLMLAAVSAVAAISLKGLHEKAIEVEGEDGLVAGWSAEQKISFVDWMIDAGIELDGDQVAQLHRDDLSLWAKDAIALKLILDYYPSRDGSLTTADIIAKEKGPIEFWSVEDKAWYADVQAIFHPERMPESRYLLPAKSDLSEEAALDVFKQELAEQYQIAENAVDFSTLVSSFGEYTFDTGEGPYKLRCWFFCVQLVDENEALAYIGAADGAVVHLSVTEY